MPEDNNDLMAQRIKELRTKKGLSQEQLAELLGLQKSAIAKYEKGRVINIKRSTIANMAEIFHCTPSYIMGWDEETLDEIRYDLMADREAQQEKIYELMKNCFDDSSIYLLQAYSYLWDQYKNLLLQYTERLMDLQNADISTSLENSERTRSNAFFDQMIANKKLTNASHEKQNIIYGMIDNITPPQRNNIDNTLLAAHEDNNASEDDKKADIKLLKDYKSNKKDN